MSTTAVKISILFYYRRIFWVQASFRRWTIILGVLSICWGLTAVLGITLYCIPLQKFWRPYLQGQCMNYNVFFLVVFIIDTTIDVSLLCLPLWVIGTLQLNRKQRVSVMAIFLLGGL